MSEEIKKELEKIEKYIKEKKTKTLLLSEVYEELKLPYLPNTDKIIFGVLLELEKEGYIEHLKTSKRNYIGSFEKYKILHLKKENEERIKEEILKLDKKIKIDYLLKNPNEYMKNKEIILPINEFIKNKSKEKSEKITVNERSYEIYKNEKLLKENENLIKKLGLSYKDLYAYDTYEPFFYYINTLFSSKNKKILVIENKDTFWTIVRAIQELRIDKIYMVIYGEGKKILKSFSFIEEFNIDKNDTVYYFGDIDYEGINIYESFKKKFCDYNIEVFKKGYETILDIEKSPEIVRKNQNINKEKIEKFLKEFNGIYVEKLEKIFKNKKYIPQEVFNYEIALKKMK